MFLPYSAVTNQIIFLYRCRVLGQNAQNQSIIITLVFNWMYFFIENSYTTHPRRVMAQMNGIYAQTTASFFFFLIRSAFNLLDRNERERHGFENEFARITYKNNVLIF